MLAVNKGEGLADPPEEGGSADDEQPADNVDHGITSLLTCGMTRNIMEEPTLLGVIRIDKILILPVPVPSGVNAVGVAGLIPQK